MTATTAVLDEVRAANERYARRFNKGDLPMPPARRFAVVTCMDARIDPAKALGLEEGDAHVIRNAGGLVSDDAIRSLVISQTLLGTEEAIIIGHSDCGMLTFTNEDIREKLAAERGADGSEVDFLPFANVADAVRKAVRAVTESPLLRVAASSRVLRGERIRLRGRVRSHRPGHLEGASRVKSLSPRGGRSPSHEFLPRRVRAYGRARWPNSDFALISHERRHGRRS